MKIINVNGIIGWDFTSDDMQRELNAAMGEDVTIQISSGGGDVYDAVSIFNYVRDYSSVHNVDIVVHGLAGSAASYIALAGNKKPIVHDNSIFFIHNPWSFAIGDYREMAKAESLLSGLTNMFVKAYMRISGQPELQIREWMNEEKFFFGGDEIMDAGFSDHMIETEEKEEPMEMQSNAKTKVYGVMQYVKSHPKDISLDKVAAMIGHELPKARKPVAIVTPYIENAELREEEWDASASEDRWRDHSGVESNEDLPDDTYSKRFAWYDAEDSQNFAAYKLPHWDYRDGEFVNISAVRAILRLLPQTEDIPADDRARIESNMESYLERWEEQAEQQSNIAFKPAGAGKNITGGKTVKNLEELKNQFPDIYAAAVKVGVDKERERVSAHMQWVDADKDKVMAAIENGEDFTMAHMSRYAKAQGNKSEVQAAIDENPDGISTPSKDNEDPSAVTKEETEDYTNKFLAFVGKPRKEAK